MSKNGGFAKSEITAHDPWPVQQTWQPNTPPAWQSNVGL